MAASVASAGRFHLFVERIPWTVALNELKEYFGQFGTVKRCFLPFNKETGFHKGVGWVSFVTEEGAIIAMQKDSHVLEGAKINVQWRKSKQNPSQHMDTNDDTS